MFQIMIRRQTSHLFPPVATAVVVAGTGLSDHLLNITPFPPLDNVMKCGHQLATEDAEILTI